MPARNSISVRVLAAALLCFEPILAAAGTCEFTVLHDSTVYSFDLASPTPKYPHGVLSEDGFYKVAVNETLLWFQLCDRMVFNHDPPQCYDCQDCGGPLRCGTRCSALVGKDKGGYPVCRTIGQASNVNITLIDENNPQKGVTLKMASTDRKNNCSLSVSVLCDPNKAQGPESLTMSETCNYATVLRHPSGCAKAISVNGNGLGWFGTLIITIICLLGGYILIGSIYRFFFLGIHGAQAIPNLEFWLSLPQRARSMLGSVVTRFGGRPQDRQQGSYATVHY